MSDLPTIFSFWHGPMSWLEALCIASFRRHGHRVEVYSFDPIPGLPDGAIARDAAEVLPRDALTFYKGKGTPAVFSDHFRVMALKQSRGVYADLDLYLVRPIATPSDYLMAYERPGSVNSAVLYIPPEAPLLDDLLAIFSGSKPRLIEPHLPPLRRYEVAIRRLLGARLPPQDIQYGSTGPMALTYHVQKRGLSAKVLPGETFYPIPYAAIPPLMQPGSSIDPAIRPNTIGVHLWRSQFTKRGRADMPPPPPGSAMAELCAREEIAI